MHSSLLTPQISIDIPHLTLPVRRGACRPQNGAQAAKLWLPELSAKILVQKKIMPRLPLSCCDLFVVRIKNDAYSMLMQNIIGNLKHFFTKVYLEVSYSC